MSNKKQIKIFICTGIILFAVLIAACSVIPKMNSHTIYTTKNDTAKLETTTVQTPSDDNFININTADASELAEVYGCNSTAAKAIVAYRAENGPFNNINEITDVPGVGEAMLIKMFPYITV